MAEPTRQGEAKPEAKPDPGPERDHTRPTTPAAETVNSQDKQKDKPDSGQNEDG